MYLRSVRAATRPLRPRAGRRAGAARLNTKRAEAWQILIRGLTHGIGRSVTPISPLRDPAHDLLEAEPVRNWTEPGVRTVFTLEF